MTIIEEKTAELEGAEGAMYWLIFQANLADCYDSPEDMAAKVAERKVKELRFKLARLCNSEAMAAHWAGIQVA